MLLLQLFPDVEELVIITAVLNVNIFALYRLGQMYLMVYFWRIGSFFLNILLALYVINAFKLKVVLGISFMFEIISPLFSLLYWFYPISMFFRKEECGEWFEDARSAIHYIYQIRYFFQGVIMIVIIIFVQQ